MNGTRYLPPPSPPDIVPPCGRGARSSVGLRAGSCGRRAPAPRGRAARGPSAPAPAAPRRVPLGCSSPGASGGGERLGTGGGVDQVHGGRGAARPSARRAGLLLPLSLSPVRAPSDRRGAQPAVPRPQTAGYLCRGLRDILVPAAGGGGRGRPSPRPPPRPAAGLRLGAPPPRTGVPRSRGRRRRKQVEIKE